jgi:hypothetical protein
VACTHEMLPPLVRARLDQRELTVSRGRLCPSHDCRHLVHRRPVIAGNSSLHHHTPSPDHHRVTDDPALGVAGRGWRGSCIIRGAESRLPTALDDHGRDHDSERVLFVDGTSQMAEPRPRLVSQLGRCGLPFLGSRSLHPCGTAVSCVRVDKPLVMEPDIRNRSDES